MSKPFFCYNLKNIKIQNFHIFTSSNDVSPDSDDEDVKETDFDKQFSAIFSKDNILGFKDLINNNQTNSVPISNSSLDSNNENKLTYSFDTLNPYFNIDVYNSKNSIHKKEKIFNITKTNKKIGRMKKNSTIKGNHNNFSEDNIIRKLKGRFIEKLRKYINYEHQRYLFKKNLKKRKNNNWLKKINPGICRKIKKEDNLKWFETKIYEIFSENISERYSNSSIDLNKRKILRIFKQTKANTLINILNSKIELYFDKYINDELVEGFETIKDDIEQLENTMKKANQENINEYLEKYRYTAVNLKKIFNQKKERRIINKGEKY